MGLEDGVMKMIEVEREGLGQGCEMYWRVGRRREGVSENKV